MILNVAKAMYCQFEKKTILIEMKIDDSRDNNPVINIKNDEWALVPFLVFFCARSISFIYLYDPRLPLPLSLPLGGVD